MSVNIPPTEIQSTPEQSSFPQKSYIIAETHTGLKRKENQDAYSNYYPGLVIVADGVGGAKRGDYASQLPCFSCRNPDYLKEDLLRVNWQVFNESQAFNITVATTVVAAAESLINPNNYLVYNVGDSPGYLFDTNTRSCREITNRDERQKGSKRVVTKSIGGSDTLREQDIHINEIYLEQGQFLILTTDGFSDYLDRGAITTGEVFQSLLEDPRQTPHKMIETALRCGGKDNITVVVIGHHN